MPRPTSPGVRPARLGQGGEATPILVVDDDPQALRFMRDALAEAGYAPITTGDPRELARILQIEKPELVLLDLMLPETDGIRLMETVPELADRPVIFISGYRRDETIARALEMGAADYIVKPFSPTELTPGSRRPFADAPNPNPSCLETWPSTTSSAGSPWAAVPFRLRPPSTSCWTVLSVSAGRVATYDALIRTGVGWGPSRGAGPGAHLREKPSPKAWG